MKNDNFYLEHILEAIKQVEKYSKGKKYAKFYDDEIVYDAIIRQLAVIGEATNKLSRDFKKENSEMDFRVIIGMRNFLIHEYFNIDKKIIWKTCREDLVEYKKFIKQRLKE